MTNKEIKQIQSQGHFDIGRLLTESELREIVYTTTGSSCFTWGDILDYVSSRVLDYSVDFIMEARENYAKEYVAEHHSSKTKAIQKANEVIQVGIFYDIVQDVVCRVKCKQFFEILMKLHKEGYFKLFE